MENLLNLWCLNKIYLISSDDVKFLEYLSSLVLVIGTENSQLALQSSFFAGQRRYQLPFTYFSNLPYGEGPIGPFVNHFLSLNLIKAMCVWDIVRLKDPLMPLNMEYTIFFYNASKISNFPWLCCINQIKCDRLHWLCSDYDGCG